MKEIKQKGVELVLCLAALLLMAAPGLAGAADKEGWTLLGPAWSHHSGLEGSYIRDPEDVYGQCTVTTGVPIGESMRCTDKIEGSYGYKQAHMGLGIQRDWIDADGSKTLAFFNVVQDSYAQWGAMAGAGRTWRIGRLGRLELAAGLAGGLWARSSVTGTHTDGQIDYCVAFTVDGGAPKKLCSKLPRHVSTIERVTVPFLLPLVEIHDTRTGLGLRLSVAPKFHLDGVASVPTTTVMLQTTSQF